MSGERESNWYLELLRVLRLNVCRLGKRQLDNVNLRRPGWFVRFSWPYVSDVSMFAVNVSLLTLFSFAARLETALTLRTLESHCTRCLGIPIVQSRIECG